MDKSPRSLESLCLDTLAHHPEVLFTENQDNERGALLWRDPDVSLQSVHAEKLLEKLVRLQPNYNQILAAFPPPNTHLRYVTLAAENISRRALEALRDQPLRSLSLSTDGRLYLQAVTSCLGEKSCGSLQHLKMAPTLTPSRSGCLGDAGTMLSSSYARLPALTSLDVSFCDMTNGLLAVVCGSMRGLRSLNVSGNPGITCIGPLRDCGKLRFFSMAGVGYVERSSAVTALAALPELRQLDVSRRASVGCRLPEERMAVDYLFSDTLVAPDVEYLDLSGHKHLREGSLRKFLETHRSLKFLSLVQTNACNFPGLKQYQSSLTIAGEANIDQFMAALTNYASVYSSLEEILGWFIFHLHLNRWFPPERHHAIVQVLLDVIPTSTADSYELVNHSWVIAGHCLECIQQLIQKDLVSVNPATYSHLYLVCQRFVTTSDDIPHPTRPGRSVSKEPAIALLEMMDNDLIPVRT